MKASLRSVSLSCLFGLVGVVPMVLASCSVDSMGVPGGSGGSPATGGTSTGTGGTSATTGSGGIGWDGGAPGTGGRTVGTGGVIRDGGAPGSGGKAGAGGAGGTTVRDGGVGQTCGTIVGLSCPANLFCDLASSCGKIADAGGVCVLTGPNLACTEQYAPVCGCDGKTYGNDCARQAAGVLKAKDGACAAGSGGAPGSGGRSGSGGTGGRTSAPGTGGNYVDGGAPGSGGRTGAGGMSGRGGSTGTGGTTGVRCGGLADGGCPAGQFCDLQSRCGAIADAMGVCTPTGPGACPAVWIPVCGCNGKTYGNECERTNAGVLKASDGACPSAERPDAAFGE